MPSTSQSTIRIDERQVDLQHVFSMSNMKLAWTQTVRPGLRKQDVGDAHDYFDFYSNVDARLKVIHQQIVSGTYFPKRPYVIRVEKGNGISRHLQIPTPEDAVVLQTLVNEVGPHLLRHQPTKNAFFSRSHSRKSIEDVDESFPYDWRQLWPDFQRRIWDFTAYYPYVVVTDVANFFDNIPLAQLRNIITSSGNFQETLIDFLFYMLERFVWRPDYLPLSGVGLPQINFDAPRLLAHCFLFEVDRYLNGETNGDFVRWMDDIDFGVDSIDRGRLILHHVDELMLTRGIRLNTGKTLILSSSEAKHYFLPDENRYLTILTKRIERRLDRSQSVSKEILRLRERFVRFTKRPKVGNWDKVYKRYFTIAGKVRHPFLERHVPGLLEHNPKMRDAIFAYYARLGPNKNRISHIVHFIQLASVREDSALFKAARLLVDWQLPRSGKLHRQIVSLALSRFSDSEMSLLASLWVLAKYGTDDELVTVINQSLRVWSQSAFLSRQVAAILPRLRRKPHIADNVVKNFVVHGQTEALSVVSDLDRLRELRTFPSRDRKYLTSNLRHVYPLEKFLMLVDVLGGELDLAEKKSLIDAVTSLTADSTYSNVLSSTKISLGL